MAVPPLHHGILHARVGRVRFPERHGNFNVIDDMQNRDGQDVRTKEPIRHINMFNFSFDDRSKKYDRVRNPNERDQDIDRPLELGIFFTGGDP